MRSVLELFVEDGAHTASREGRARSVVVLSLALNLVITGAIIAMMRRLIDSPDPALCQGTVLRREDSST